MLSVNVGTTNLDSTGSATNLTDENSVLTALDGEDYTASIDDGVITVTADYWNAPLAKEVQINAADFDVELTDFVDVDVNLEESCDNVSVNVSNAKRGEINTGSGDDTVVVSVQSNDSNWVNRFTVNTDAGNDSIIFTNSKNSQYTSLDIDAGAGNDYIDISGLNANLISADERILDGGSGDDTIIGSDGAETIIGGAGDDYIIALDGDDIISAGSGNDYIIAGDGNDTVYGGYGDDVIFVGAGDDTINAGYGDDVIDGAGGDDVIDAGAGDDVIYAGSGDDVIYGNYGDDSIYAGAGDDVIDAGEGSDTILAGEGNDSVVFDSDDIIINGGEGLDALIVSGNVTIENTINFEAIIGETGSDDNVTMALTDGLIVALGADDGDELYFENVDSFTFSDSVLSDAMIEYVSSVDIDVTILTAYESNEGNIVWTDVDLLA